MQERISSDELKHKIVTSIRSEGLDGIFTEDTVEKIREKVTQEYLMQQERLMDVDLEDDNLQETDMRPPIVGGPNQFPYEDDFVSAGDVEDVDVEGEPIGVEAGASPTDIPYEPVRAVTPEVPDPLKEQEPGEIIVFDYNDVAAVSGENLANKPFRTMDDPESMQTIHDFWMKEGKNKVKVYAAKFEEIGTIEFDYRNGSAHFLDIKAPIEPQTNTYQENPYAAASEPQVEVPSTETDLRKSVESSVDLEAIMTRVVKDILRDGLSDAPDTVEPTIPTPAPIANPVQEQENSAKETYIKTKVPEAIKSKLLGENQGRVQSLGKTNESSTFKLEGKTYVVFNDDNEFAYMKP